MGTKKRRFLLLLVLALVCGPTMLLGQVHGPYVFDEGRHTVSIKWVEQNQAHQVTLTDQRADSLLRHKFGTRLYPNWRKELSSKPQLDPHLKNIDTYIALSDLHGQFDLFKQLLQNNGVVDQQLNWRFGKGVLVIVGDIFDRGPDVDKILWLIYRLEQEAKEKGGRLLYMLGNHELMVLDNDLRYVNKQDLAAAELLGHTYPELYGENTVLGRWIRKKPAVLRVNKTLFLHGGISPALVDKKISIRKINKSFFESIIPEAKSVYRQDSLHNFLARTNGPLWYRGYFKEGECSQKDLDRILRYFKIDHIVVGHTTQDRVKTLYQNRVFAVDSGIKQGKKGEALLYQAGRYFRLNQLGEKVALE